MPTSRHYQLLERRPSGVSAGPCLTSDRELIHAAPLTQFSVCWPGQQNTRVDGSRCSGVTDAFKRDTAAEKVNLGVGEPGLFCNPAA